MANKRITFKNTLDFNREKTEKFIFPEIGYDLKLSVPPGIPKIKDPVIGEVYYFDDPGLSRPGLFVYVGKRGEDFAPGLGLPEDGERRFNFDSELTSAQVSAIQGWISDGVYLHIYTGNNVGVHLIDSVDTEGVTISLADSVFEEDDSSVEFSILNSSVFSWIDIARPEQYLRLFEFQKIIDAENKLPFDFISNVPLTTAQLNNLSDNLLADGSDPWTQNTTDISNLSATQTLILEKVELRNFSLPPNTLLSGNSISLTEAIEEIDLQVLANGRNNYLIDPVFEFGVLVTSDNYVDDSSPDSDINPTMQIGGERNPSEGLRTGVLFMTEWDESGRYPFIRSDRDINTTGSHEEPDYSWYPDAKTGFYSTNEDRINVTIQENESFRLIHILETETNFQLLYEGDVIEEQIVRETEISKVFHVDNYSSKWDNNLTLFSATRNGDFVDEIKFYPFLSFNNIFEDQSENIYFRFDNFDGFPRLFFYNHEDDRIGSILADPNEPGDLNIEATNHLNFMVEQEYRAAIDTYTGTAREIFDLATEGILVEINNTSPINFESVDYFDWLQFSTSNSDYEKFEVGDFVVVEESVNGNIRRFFYDSLENNRYVQGIYETGGEVFILLKPFTDGVARQLQSPGSLKRVILYKNISVPQTGRFSLSGIHPVSQELIKPGGLRMIPHNSISLFSYATEEGTKDIYVSPSEKDIFRFSHTLSEDTEVIVPFFELTSQSRISLGFIASNEEGDLMMSGFGGRTYLFARNSYLNLIRDNPTLTTFELAGSNDSDEGNFRMGIYGQWGNTDIWVTRQQGNIRFRNPIVYYDTIVDLANALPLSANDIPEIDDDINELPVTETPAGRPDDPVEIYPAPLTITKPIKVPRERSVDDISISRVARVRERRSFTSTY